MTDGRIVLLTTGGTVAAHTTVDGAIPRLTADELVPASTHADIEAVDLMSVDSSAMTPAEQLTVVRGVLDALADTSTDGVVVTHGTDTLEETAYLTDLFVTGPKPVVFTGAQHPADSPASDGPANITDAVAAAVSASHRDRGVLVTMGGRILPARGLFKSSTTAPSAFENVHDALPRRTLGDRPPSGALPRVDAFELYPGISPGLISAAVSQRTSGMVLATTGSGNTHPDITAEVAAAIRAGTVVVVTSRVPFGEVTPAYGGGGGGVDLVRAGALISPWLRAPQARIALMALLSIGASTEDIRAFFDSVRPPT